MNPQEPKHKKSKKKWKTEKKKKERGLSAMVALMHMCTHIKV
jgi:hypothetical protein